MPATIKTIADSILAGKNAVVTSKPDAAAALKILKILEENGINTSYLDMAHYAGLHLGQSTLEGNEIRLRVAEDFLLAETVILDNGAYITGNTLEIVARLMTDRTVYGMTLSGIKSVVVIFTEDPRGNAPKLSRVPNTVKIDIR